jgi:hypothetical protein
MLGLITVRRAKPPIQVQPDPGAGQPVVGDLRQRGREPDSNGDTLPAYR